MAETATYLRKLTLENVRCFGSQPQELILAPPDGRPYQWTVILGENGTGKTTLLECAVEIQCFYKGGSTLSFDTTHPREYERNLRSLPSVNQRKNAVVGYELEIGKSLGDTQIPQTIEHQYCEIAYEDTGLWYQKNSTSKYTAPMICAYGTVRRMGRIRLEYNESDSRAGVRSLYDPTYELQNASEWLMQLDYSATRAKLDQKELAAKSNFVTELLVNILPDVSDIRITTPTRKYPYPRVEFQTPDGWLPLSWIGHGYRTLVAWMVDFASRMVERYPDSKDPLSEPAVVLVDEIDLHLHPKWQRELMGYLSQRFPNTQFIVTAHSPIFVQAAENANLVVLRRDKNLGHVVIENAPEKIKGWRLDQILTSDLFGLPSARSPEVEKLQAERVEILSKPKLTAKDKKRVAELESAMGGLPAGETAADVKTNQLLADVLKSLERQTLLDQTEAGESP